MAEVIRFPGNFNKPKEASPEGVDQDDEKEGKGGTVSEFKRPDKRPRPQPPAETRSLESRSRLGLMERTREVFPDLDFGNFLRLRIMLPNLSHQEGHTRARRLEATYEETVKTYTDEELVGWINGSSDKDWSQRPAWYAALCSEISRRSAGPRPDSE